MSQDQNAKIPEQHIGQASAKYEPRPRRALKPDAQAFDAVTIETVPRWKESEMSGDEWRISALVRFWRKGVVIYERGYRNIEMACFLVGAAHVDACDDGKGYFAGERDACDQEGCACTATVTYRLKAEYDRGGHKSEPLGPTYRLFCNRHKDRGDCGLEDADDNYEAVTETAESLGFVSSSRPSSMSEEQP